ncbi:MAG: ATP-binding cassette domain-containing protein [Clostridia bacterium]|nr:ATP-binding cassette domain-containing protein [Clostridia bacterium]
MAENEEVLLRVEHLCQYFSMGAGRELKAVDDVSFDVKKGEVFGLVGESGCGKTTTGRSIIRLYDITSGNVYFKGKRVCAGVRSYKNAIKAAKADFKAGKITKEECDKIVAEQKEQIKLAIHDHKLSDKEYAVSLLEELKKEYTAKFEEAADDREKLLALKKEFKSKCRIAKNTKMITKIQMIFQDPIASLDPRMTVRDIISEGMVINGITDKAYIDETVYNILERVGLVREHAGRYPHEFSGGQRQRIGIARSVVMKPEMIIADEPVSALDVSIQAQVINLLNDLRHELGISILFIAHDLSVVKYFSDRIGVMYFGKMVELATSDELFAHPLHPYTKSLLSAIPLPDPEYEKKRKRITYNPLAEHDYSVDKPSLREVSPGHFVQCNQAEFEKYVAELSKN